MISGQFDAVIPILCVTLAGLVVLLAEAFRGRGERMPLGGLAIIGLVGAGIASILLWDSGAESFGVVSADNFGPVRQRGAGGCRHPDRRRFRRRRLNAIACPPARTTR